MQCHFCWARNRWQRGLRGDDSRRQSQPRLWLSQRERKWTRSVFTSIQIVTTSDLHDVPVDNPFDSCARYLVMCDLGGDVDEMIVTHVSDSRVRRKECVGGGESFVRGWSIGGTQSGGGEGRFSSLY